MVFLSERFNFRQNLVYGIYMLFEIGMGNIKPIVQQ